jgi:hypothetical protein
MPPLVTLFVAPWKARVDCCCALVAGPDARRLGGIANFPDRYLGITVVLIWMRWLRAVRRCGEVGV